MNKINSIQVLGSGCPTCKKLFELTKQAVSDLKANVEVEYITDIQKIIELGVMSSPVLAIDGKPILVGSLPSIEKIKELLTVDCSQAESKKSDCCSGGCNC